MTKQHFIALADVIREHNRVLDTASRARFTPEQVEALADYCASQNPRFDRERWLGYIKGTNGPSGGVGCEGYPVAGGQPDH